MGAACFFPAVEATEAGGAEAIEVRKGPPITAGVEAFPRLISGAMPGVVKRINAALARADKQAQSAVSACRREAKGRFHWTRQVSVTMAGPRYLSLLALDNYFCGGAYPDSSKLALVFDLTAGALVDWAKLLPLLAEKTGTDAAADGSKIGTVSSASLSSLYKDKVKRAGGSLECARALDELDLSFMLWPETEPPGIVVQPLGLPHVISACGPPISIELNSLKTLAASPDLLTAIKAAR
jgi:hypothetical protein